MDTDGRIIGEVFDKNPKTICIASALWGTLIVYFGDEVLDSQGFVHTVLEIALFYTVGFPMLFFVIRERLKTGQEIDFSDVFWAFLAGGALTIGLSFPIILALKSIIPLIL